MWTHNAGNKAELAAITQIVNDYNASQSKYKVERAGLPAGLLQPVGGAAAAAKKLPCILDIDGPERAELGLGRLPRPAGGHGRHRCRSTCPACSASTTARPTPSATTTSHWPCVARKSVLEKYGIRIPTIDQPWTKDEFTAALKTIKDSGDYRYPLDIATELHRRVVALRLLARCCRASVAT